MYEIRGMNRKGQLESILVHEKGISETMNFASNYFMEVKFINFSYVFKDMNKN